jgi:type I restriction enzyme R subunit
MRKAGWRTFASNAEAQADYDRKLALKVDSLVGFVKETQPQEWAKIEGLYGTHTQERFLKRLVSELVAEGNEGR